MHMHMSLPIRIHDIYIKMINPNRLSISMIPMHKFSIVRFQAKDLVD